MTSLNNAHHLSHLACDDLDHALGASDGFRAVSDDQSGQRQMADGIRHGALIAQVQMTGGLVQRQHARLLVERARANNSRCFWLPLQALHL